MGLIYLPILLLAVVDFMAGTGLVEVLVFLATLYILSVATTGTAPEVSGTDAKNIKFL